MEFSNEEKKIEIIFSTKIKVCVEYYILNKSIKVVKLFLNKQELKSSEKVILRRTFVKQTFEKVIGGKCVSLLFS